MSDFSPLCCCNLAPNRTAWKFVQAIVRNCSFPKPLTVNYTIPYQLNFNWGNCRRWREQIIQETSVEGGIMTSDTQYDPRACRIDILASPPPNLHSLISLAGGLFDLVIDGVQDSDSHVRVDYHRLSTPAVTGFWEWTGLQEVFPANTLALCQELLDLVDFNNLPWPVIDPLNLPGLDFLVSVTRIFFTDTGAPFQGNPGDWVIQPLAITCDPHGPGGRCSPDIWPIYPNIQGADIAAIYGGDALWGACQVGNTYAMDAATGIKLQVRAYDKDWFGPAPISLNLYDYNYDADPGLQKCALTGDPALMPPPWCGYVGTRKLYQAVPQGSFTNILTLNTAIGNGMTRFVDLNPPVQQ